MASILMISAALFYEDTLVPAAQDVSLLTWSGLPNPDIPILFRGCETEEDWIEEGAVSIGSFNNLLQSRSPSPVLVQ